MAHFYYKSALSLPLTKGKHIFCIKYYGLYLQIILSPTQNFMLNFNELIVVWPFKDAYELFTQSTPIFPVLPDQIAIRMQSFDMIANDLEYAHQGYRQHHTSYSP